MQTWLAHFKVRPKLLVVDDQRINILVLNELFREDCDVFMATSGEQALQVCRAQLPDLVLLDVQMDGIDGYEVCRRLKADAESRDIPVIFITAQGGGRMRFVVCNLVPWTSLPNRSIRSLSERGYRLT